MTMPTPHEILSTLAPEARALDVFGSIKLGGDVLELQVRSAEVSAHYYVHILGACEAQVGLRTADRWVSESIEADLVHTGDSLDELLEDELVDLDSALPLKVDHFRDENKRYTFGSKVNWSGDENPVSLLLTVLRAYEATFRQLGDLKPVEE